MSIGKIKKIICERMGVSLEALDSRSRLKRTALARQIAMFYAYAMGNTRVEVGRKFKRDHSNVTHAVKKVKQWRECDWEVRAMLEGIEDEYPVLKKDTVVC
jgi:chromosomal replication initiation ATPase DnaA